MKHSGSLWRRSTRCEFNHCVEVSLDAAQVFVRDAKNLTQPVLVLSHSSWRAFCADLRAGRFDPTEL
jgi:hypothetical protein